MVGSIDPRCETVRGTHWPKPGRVVDWNSRRGNHLGQRFKPTASTGRTYGCKRSDLTQKTLVPRGPSTYGVDAAEQVVLRKRLGRKAMVDFFAELPPTVVGMEACGVGHYWARVLGERGHQVKLIAPQHVQR